MSFVARQTDESAAIAEHIQNLSSKSTGDEAEENMTALCCKVVLPGRQPYVSAIDRVYT